MTAPVFVDTNVFVYARDSRDPLKQQRAMAWLEQLWRSGLGRTSTQVLSEYFVTVTRKLAHPMQPDEAWEDVQALMCWNPQPIDRDLMTGAREIARRHGLSWWDSLVVAAAQAQQCAVLLSEDLHAGADYGGVTVRSPFEQGVSEPAASGRNATGSGTRAKSRSQATLSSGVRRRRSSRQGG